MKLNRLGHFLIFVAIVVLPSLLLINSCQHDGVPADQLPAIQFTEVLPIFQNNCATSGCHDAKSSESGYAFNDYASIMKAVQPGNASKSEVYQAITGTIKIMPPNYPLTTSQRTLIRLWIEQGAKQ